MTTKLLQVTLKYIRVQSLSQLNVVLLVLDTVILATLMTRQRSFPNILIAGTPGTGKSSLVQELMSSHDISQHIHHIDVSEYVKEHSLHEGLDGELDSYVIDDDALIDHLKENVVKPRIKNGGIIFDYHDSDFIPPEWIDRVYVLRTDNTKLYDRLKSRGYNETKLRNNLEAEIFQTILDQAKDAFTDVVELQSNTKEDLASNTDLIRQYILSSKKE